MDVLWGMLVSEDSFQLQATHLNDGSAGTHVELFPHPDANKQPIVEVILCQRPDGTPPATKDLTHFKVFYDLLNIQQPVPALAVADAIDCACTPRNPLDRKMLNDTLTCIPTAAGFTA